MQDLTNSALNLVKNALSYVFFDKITAFNFLTAPVFIWLGAFSLLLFFLFCWFKLRSATRKLSRSLANHQRQVAESIKNKLSLTGEVLEDIATNLESCSVVGHAWREFRETLLTEDVAGVKLVFNTRAANEFFSKEDVLESNLRLAWYHVVPGVLTGSGLFFTFLAILMGLTEVVEPGSAEISQAGMIRLVESLSGKFITSVCALFLATMFVLCEKRLTNKAERVYKSFVRTLDARFPRRSSEYLLEKIVASSSEQANQLRNFGADLSGRLKQGMTESFQPILERLVLAIDQLEREKSETLQGSMTGILEEFRNLVTNSAQGEIHKLAEVLNTTSSVLQSSNDHTVASHQKMIALMDSANEAIRLQTQTNADFLNKLTVSFEDMSKRLGSASEDSSAKISEKIQGVLTKLEESSFRTLEESKKHTQALSQIVETMSQRVEGALSGVSEIMTERISNLLSNLETASQAAASESRRQADNLSQLMETMTERVEALLVAATGNMSQAMSGLFTQTSQLSETTASRLEAMLNKQAEGAVLLKQAGETVEQSIGIFQGLLASSSEAHVLYEQSIHNLHEISNAVLDDLKLARSVQSDFGVVSSSLRDAGVKLSEVQAEHINLLEEYRKVFGTLDSQLGALIERLHGNTQIYNERVKMSLSEKLADFDKHLSSATSILGGTVSELNDALTDLNETLDTIKQTTVVSLQEALGRLAG